MNQRRFLPIIIIYAVFLLVGCSNKTANSVASISEIQSEKLETLQRMFTAEELNTSVAKLKNKNITISDLLYKYEEAGTRGISHLQGDPDKIATFLEDAIMEDLAYEKAIKAGFDNSPSVQQQEQVSRERGMLAVLKEKDIDSQVNITEEMLLEYYEKNKEGRFTKKEQVKVNRIVVSTKALAEEVLGRLKANEEFLVLAGEYSTSKNYSFSIAKGSRQYAEIEDEAFALEIGEISEPIKVKAGYAILKLIDSRDSFVLPFEKMKDAIYTELFHQKANQIQKEKLEEWKKELGITIYRDVLDGADLQDKNSDETIAEISPTHKITVADFLQFYPVVEGDNLERRIEALEKNLERPILLAIAEKKGYDTAHETKRQIISDKKRMVTQEFYTQKLVENVTVTEKEIQDFYNKSKIELRASLILTEAEGKARQALRKLNEGNDFAAVATKYSDDTGSARYGGELGYFKWGNMEPEFEEIVFNMKVGEITDVIKTDMGYIIVKLTEKRPAQNLQPYDKMRNGIENIIKGRKVTKQTQDFFDSLKQDSGFEIEPDGIELFAEKIIEMDNLQKEKQPEKESDDNQ